MGNNIFKVFAEDYVRKQSLLGHRVLYWYEYVGMVGLQSHKTTKVAYATEITPSPGFGGQKPKVKVWQN